MARGTDVRRGATLLRFRAQTFKPLLTVPLLAAGVSLVSYIAHAQTPDSGVVAAVHEAVVLATRALNSAQHRIQPTQEEVDEVERLAVALFEEGEIQALTPRVRWLIAVRPNSWRALWLDSHISMLQGEMDRACEISRRCLAITPNHGPCHFVQGVALRHLGRLDEGVSHLREASDWGGFEPRYSEPYARALLDDGHAEEAAEVVGLLLNAGHEGVTLRLLAATASEALGRLHDAEGHYSWVYYHHPSPVSGLRYLLEFYQRHGRIAEARELLASWERAQGPRGNQRVMRPLR